MEINIREAVATDKDFILFANRQIDDVSKIETSFFAKNADEDVFSLKKCVCLIAECEGRSVAMALFSKVYWADRGEGVYISQIFVEPQFRQKGIMKRFLKEIIDYYEDTNFVTCLVSRQNQTMLSCMHSMGFDDENMSSFAINKSDFLKK
jgi:GNAT superfamily N-acetyltransferase